MGKVSNTYIECYVFLDALLVCLKHWPSTSKTPKCKRPLGLREQKSRGGYPIDSVPHLPLTSPCPCDPSYIIKNKPTDALAYSLKAQMSPHLLHLLHLLGPSLPFTVTPRSREGLSSARNHGHCHASVPGVVPTCLLGKEEQEEKGGLYFSAPWQHRCFYFSGGFPGWEGIVAFC